MSFDVNWDIESYREEHESEDHWLLRKRFMERWKSDYPEQRLVCLARVFANMELLGCRYPTEVMQEVAKLSHDVAKIYRDSRKDKLQRTFVAASTAAEDRARGKKREGGVLVEGPPAKSTKINFVPQGFVAETSNDDEENKSDSDTEEKSNNDQNNSDGNNSFNEKQKDQRTSSEVIHANDYMNDMLRMRCLDVRRFHERMFDTAFGCFVLLIRPWADMYSNIQSSCQSCNLQLSSSYVKNCFSMTINGQLLAQATGPTKLEAKNAAEVMAWNRLKEETVSLLIKEQWIAHGDRVSARDMTGKPVEFGAPVENSIAAKMMAMMGWKGGGLGAEAQGIAEPIKPHLQMVNRAGLGSQSCNIKQIRRAAKDLMQRYIAADTFDLDLVFSSEFSKDERAALHQIAKSVGLASRSYGRDDDHDRFLVVRKKLNPFALVKAVVEKGGNTPKYQVFIPASMGYRR